ncbi:MAG: hypothetical protein IPO37_18790 [Saprospiraceae bacterium]|nr:hypothetical protein [Saprospiraceae bacterium]
MESTIYFLVNILVAKPRKDIAVLATQAPLSLASEDRPYSSVIGRL